MGFFRKLTKGIAKTFFDVPSWLGLQQLKEETKELIGWVRPFMTPKKIKQESTFKQAMKHFDVTEKELSSYARQYLFLSFFYSLLGLLSLLYAIYHFYHRHLVAGLITILISLFIFLQAFVMHFWYFEIKHHKLGCTFHEWLSGQIKES
jgi:intracellular multiplication protein IcmV